MNDSPLRVYVAGASATLDRARSFMSAVRLAGFVVTSRWVEKIDEVGAANEGVPPAVANQAALDNLHDIARAHVLALLAPPKGRGYGTGVEFGFALAKGIWTVVVGAEREIEQSIFFRRADYLCPSEEAAIRHLRRYAEMPALAGRMR